MKKSCQYCGRMHNVGETCLARKRVYMPKGKRSADEFRSSYQWQRKRAQINERDHYLCQWCLRLHVITYEGIEVHHIDSLEERYDLRLEDENLIDLCTGDHKKAEAGLIPKDELRKIAKANTTPLPSKPPPA